MDMTKIIKKSKEIDDINSEINIINQLLQSDDLQKLNEYIGKLSQKYLSERIITGHIMQLPTKQNALSCIDFLNKLKLVKEAELSKDISSTDKMKFDYTKWGADQFDELTLAELNQKAAEYDKANPFTGNAEIL